MSTTTKRNQTFFYSTAGLCVSVLILILVNYLAAHSFVRADFTDDKLHTLSPGTKEVLSRLKSPVTIRFYCTQEADAMPNNLKSYGARIEDLLKEFELVGDGKIRIEIHDPEPDSDAEDAAALDGIEGQQIAPGERIYFGLAVSCVDQSLSVPFVSPAAENRLEYNITRMIYRVSDPQELKIGIMSSFPVMGGANAGMPPMPRQPREPAWVFVDELKKDFDVAEIESTTDAIDDDVAILIVIHPKDVSETTLFAIDQFVLRGGKLVAFVDSASVMQSQFQSAPPMGGQDASSSLGKLFDAWGVEFEADKVVVDMTYSTEVGGQGGQRQVSPAVLTLDSRAMNAEDIITGPLENVIMLYAGAFTGEPAEGLKKTVLMRTSTQSQLIDSFRAQLPASTIQKDFESDDKEYALAIRLLGRFKSAFPDGKPEAPDDESDDSANSEAADNASYLAEAENDNAVILIGDADMIYDDFWVRKSNFFGQTLQQVISENNVLLQNSVEQLSGDQSLISIRSRGVTKRPFTVIRDMQMEAEKKYKQEMANLEEELSEAQQKINELQSTKKDQKQKYIMSPEQTRELEKFQEKQVEVRRRLKELRKQLRKDIDRLETRLKLVNILMMPFVVVVCGIGFYFVRRNRASSSR